MSTALDQSPANPRGLPAYQWTNWQSVFQPQLAQQLQPKAAVTPGFMGIGGTPAAQPTGAQIIDQRQAQRNQVIMQNPLWKAFRQQPQKQGMFANVAEPGSAAEDAQSFFGNVNDGSTPTGPTPAATTSSASPSPATQAPFSFKSFTSKYGSGYSVFNNTPRLGMYAGGGSKLRF